jgi:hypothetical protein
MIREKYRVDGKARARYVRRAAGKDFYEWCEQSAADPRYDVAQGTCEAQDLPDEIRAACDANKGMFYACEWPMV